MKYAVLAGLLIANAYGKQNETESAKKYVQIVEGFLMGTLDAEGFTDIEHCIQDGEGIIKDAEDAFSKFSKKDLQDIIAGVKDVADIIKLVQSAMKDCSGIKADWEKLAKMAETFRSPVSFAWHVGGDIVHNGVKITHEIEGAVSDYKSEQWFDFGKNCGEAAAHVLIGSPHEREQLGLADDAQREKQAKFFQGFFKAFGYKFDLYALLVCINQEDQAALFLDVAYQAFEQAIHDSTTSDMIGDLIGTAIGVVGAYQQFEQGLPACEAIVESDISRVRTAMEVLENPLMNLPAMTANLKKYESEIKDDVIAATFFYKTGQYDKFGEFLGNLIKVITEKENKKPTWSDSFPHDNRTAIAEFLQGFFQATEVGQFNLTNLLICIYEMDNAALAFYESAEMLEEAWEKKDWQEAVGGAIAMVAGVQGVEQSLPVCEAVDTKVHNWKNLDKIINISQDKKTAFKVVGENMVFNGVTISADMLTAMESFKLGNYNEFGVMFGEAMMAATKTKTESENNLFLY